MQKTKKSYVYLYTKYSCAVICLLPEGEYNVGFFFFPF